MHALPNGTLITAAKFDVSRLTRFVSRRAAHMLAAAVQLLSPFGRFNVYAANAACRPVCIQGTWTLRAFLRKPRLLFVAYGNWHRSPADFFSLSQLCTPESNASITALSGFIVSLFFSGLFVSSPFLGMFLLLSLRSNPQFIEFGRIPIKLYFAQLYYVRCRRTTSELSLFSFFFFFLPFLFLTSGFHVSSSRMDIYFIVAKLGEIENYSRLYYC